jgi:uncharacterized protein
MRLDANTLELDLNSIRKDTSSGSFLLRMCDIGWNLEDMVPCSPEGTLFLTVTVRDSTWICSGNLAAEFETPCARCLEPARFSVDAEVYRIYTWDEELASDLDTELISRIDGAVSVLDAVREAVILSVPGKPLCSENCRGLCSVCGANLNETKCEHTGS